MSKIALFALLIFAPTAWPAEPYANDRPMTPFPSASELVPKCEIAVKFNEDEASVPESDYLDGMFCLGMMEGILGTNAALPSETKLFCPPQPGIKTWIAARTVVSAARNTDPAVLASTDEAVFAVAALASKYPCPAADSRPAVDPH